MQAAAEAFAAENNGVYSTTADTLVVLLPGGIGLENPFTNLRTEPVVGPADTPGETGYTPIVGGGTNVGYTITGYGERRLIITISKYPGQQF